MGVRLCAGGEEVLKEDFESDCDQDNSAEHFDFALEEMAESFSDVDADIGEEECDQADDQDGGPDGVGQQ